MAPVRQVSAEKSPREECRGRDSRQSGKAARVTEDRVTEDRVTEDRVTEDQITDELPREGWREGAAEERKECPAAGETKVETVAGSRQEILAVLRDRMRSLEGERRARQAARAGVHPEDSCGESQNEPRGEGWERLLPEGRIPPGTLVEWFAAGEASGAGTLALLAAKSAAVEGGAIVVLDRQRSFYPPAAAALGIKLDQLIVIRAGKVDDELWACDQALRCVGVAAVWGMLERLPQRWFRRLQLAAERGGGIGHFLRPARVRGEPSWAYAQFWVQPLASLNSARRPAGSSLTGSESPGRFRGALFPEGADSQAGNRGSGTDLPAGGRRWRVELTRCYGLASGGAVEVELDGQMGAVREISHAARPLHLVSQLADPAPARRSARA